MLPTSIDRFPHPCPAPRLSASWSWGGRTAVRHSLAALLGSVFFFVGLIDVRGADKGEGSLDFAHQIAPILSSHCVECHGGEEAKGGFSLNSRELFLDGGMAEPGEVEDSYFLELITSDDADRQMPPKEKRRLTEQEIALLKQWVATEMPWTPGFSFAAEHYVPPLRPRRPDLPAVRDGREHPIDRLIGGYFRELRQTQPEEKKDDAKKQGRESEAAWPLQRLEDASFIRRVSLDLIGLPPTAEELTAFLKDRAPDKRSRLIAELLADDVRYAEHWLTFWNDLLRNDYTGTGFITGGRKQISRWLYRSLVDNKPFDQMASELLAPPTPDSRGFIDGIKWRGEVSAGQTLEIQFAQSISQSLLGINMKCASCHDSFIDHWTLKDAYGLAAIYADQPLEIHRCDKPTGETAVAAWLFPELGEIDAEAPTDQRLRQLARLMTSDENGRFARTIVNRLWFQLMGRGIVHPVDAMQTEPWHVDLLDFLAIDLVDHDYDLKRTLMLIASSQAYQSRSEPVETGQDDSGYRFAGPRAKRMTAEQFVDAVWQLTDAAPGTFDAPLVRGKVDPKVAAQLVLNACWIWSAESAENRQPPPQRLAFRKRFKVDKPIQNAGAIITCDNRYTLLINGKQVQQDDDWTTVEPIPLKEHLQQGNNTLIVVATNGGTDPNPAGLFFQANIEHRDGSHQQVASDASWEVYLKVPGDKAIANWEPKTAQSTAAKEVSQDPWSETLSAQTRQQLSLALSGDRWRVRASLLKCDPLMQTLGRPNRDQIVTSRPNEMTTLEAIHLSNSQQLADWLRQGAEQWLRRPWPHQATMVNTLFRAALTRNPTPAERDLVRQTLGEEPTPEQLQDVLWALCVTPEFLLIR